METGSQIINYRGDASLGLASDTNIPTFSTEGINAVLQTGRDMMLLGHENNVKLFNQKVNDRDKTLKLLDEGAISSGAIDPDDQKFFDASTKKANAAFEKMIKAGGINNKEAYRDYKQAVSDLKTTTSYLQSRWLERKKLEADRAAQKLPSIQKKYDEHIKKEKERLAKNPLDTYNPFQQALDLDVYKDIFTPTLEGAFSSTTGGSATPSGAGPTEGGGLMPAPTETTKKVQTTATPGKTPKTTETVTTKPVKQKEQPVGELVQDANGTVFNVQRGYVDAKKIFQNAVQKTENEEASIKQRMHLNSIENPPYQDPGKAASVNKRYIDHIIQQVDKYNAQRGFVPSIDPVTGKKVFTPDQIRQGALNIDGVFVPKLEGDPSQGYHINASPDQFDALSSLASLDNYVAETRTPNEFLTKQVLERQKLGLQAQESKAKIRAMNALASERQAKAALANKKSKAVDTQFNPAQTFNEVFKGRVQSYETKAGNNVTRVNRQDVSKAFLDNLGIDPLNKEGDYNIVPTNVKFKNKSGEQIDIPEDEVQQMYKDYLDTDAAKELEKKMGTKPTILDFIYSYPNTSFEVDVIGKVKPIYKQVKTAIGTSNVLTNPQEAGKIVRSNALQSWINQRKELGVKGKGLLMEEPEDVAPEEVDVPEISK